MSDPTLDELLATCTEVAEEVADGEDPSFFVHSVCYWLCADFHTGQGSNMYEGLSQSLYRPGALDCGPEVGSVEELIYQETADRLRLTNS